jgi:hypothetical protein
MGGLGEKTFLPVSGEGLFMNNCRVRVYPLLKSGKPQGIILQIFLKQWLTN